MSHKQKKKEYVLLNTVGVASKKNVQKWFPRLQGGDFQFEDKERLGRPSNTDED